VFVSGVIFLVLLVTGTSYAQQGDQKDTAKGQVSFTTTATSSADIVHITASPPALVIQQAATATTPVTKVQISSPRVRVKEQEYDE
jgi:hypothetical protein